MYSGKRFRDSVLIPQLRPELGSEVGKESPLSCPPLEEGALALGRSSRGRVRQVPKCKKA